MANRIYQLASLFLLLTLVIWALNISNQGINQVSGESRGPVACLQWHDNDLHADWLGRSYEYSFYNFINDWARLKDLAFKTLLKSGREIYQNLHNLNTNLVS